jgi:hypothetical protein
MRFARISLTFFVLLSSLLQMLNALRLSDEGKIEMVNNITKAAMAGQNENVKKLTFTCSLVEKKMFTSIDGKCQISLPHAKEALNYKCLKVDNNVLYDNLDEFPKKPTTEYLVKNYKLLGNVKLDVTDQDLVESIPGCQLDNITEFATALMDSIFASWDKNATSLTSYSQVIIINT